MAKRAEPASDGTAGGSGNDTIRIDPSPGQNSNGVDTAAGGDSGTVRVDPDTAAPGGTASAPRQRGRPAGSTNKPRAAAAKTSSASDIAGIEFLLVSLHMMAAEATKSKELILSPVEAKLYAEAVAKVQDHYGVVIAGEAMIWTHLGAVLISIYGPRAYAIRARIAQEVNPQATQNINPAEMYVPPGTFQ